MEVPIMDNELMHPNANTPDEDPSPIIPVVYEDDESYLEYKCIQQNLDKEEPLDEKRLNELGKEGWELVTAFSQETTVHYYFKRRVS